MPTLADLFNQKSQDIYKRFSAREEPSSQPYISILPDSNDSRSRIKDDNRALPVVSTIRDTQRVSKFLRSSDGLLFIAKQTLLQTGNTFVNTKLYNPVSPLLNTIPFVYARRHLSTQVLVPNAPGLLQNNTVEDSTSKFVISGKLQALSTNRRGLLPTLGSIAKTYVETQLKKAANTIVPLPQNYTQSRPEYKVFTDTTGPVVFSSQPLDQRGLPRTSLEANIKNIIVSKAREIFTKKTANALNRVIPKSLRNTIPPIPVPETPIQIPTFVQAATQFRQNFTNKLPKNFINDTNNSRIRSKYLLESDTGFADIDTNPSSKSFGTAISGPTKLQDPYNKRKLVSTTDINKLNYNNIIKEQKRNSDIIKFIFRDAEGNNPVHFRALLSNIKESIKTEFNEQRYVGRTERFVTYGGAKRGLSLSFNIVAFSQEEIDGMWSRVNYLSGLAFPKDVVNGFMVPPLFKLTIGALYENQPCYIESLDYDFLDDTITFDVNREVPFAINVNMQLSILEKRSRYFDSPFYKISEEIADVQSITLDEETARRLDDTLLGVSTQITAEQIARNNPNAFLNPLG